MNTIDIIILEDDEDIATMITLMLTAYNYSIKTFNTVIPFQKYLETTQPYLLIMDMLLSGTKGTLICENLKQQPNTNTIKILMMSAHPDASQLCIAAGADEFIQKPFDKQQLTNAVKVIMATRL